MNPCVFRTGDHLKILQPIIERVLITVVDEPSSRDRAIRGFPREARAITPISVFALDLDVTVLRAAGTNRLSEGMRMRAAPFSNIEAVRLILMAFAVLAAALRIMRNSS